MFSRKRDPLRQSSPRESHSQARSEPQLPQFVAKCKMVRKGSPVRVRKRASSWERDHRASLHAGRATAYSEYVRNSARHAKLIALATALLVVAGSAQAAAVKVKPTASVVGATKSGKYVRFQIGVKFPIPAGASAADCSGKVTVSTKLSKKKTAKWSGKLAAVGPDCVATVKARLASAKYGKKLKFTVAFKGSKKLKPFSRSWKLRIVAPPPPPPLPPAAPPAPPPLEAGRGPQQGPMGHQPD